MGIKEKIAVEIAEKFGEETAEKILGLVGVGTKVVMPAQIVITLFFIWYRLFREKRFLGVTKKELANELHRINLEMLKTEARMEKDRELKNELDRKMKEYEYEVLKNHKRYIEIIFSLFEHKEFLEQEEDRIIAELRKKERKIGEEVNKMAEIGDKFLRDAEIIGELEETINRSLQKPS